MVRTTLKTILAGALSATAALAIAACGDDDNTSADSTTGSQPNVQRYCELVGQLDQISTDLFSKLDDTSPTKAELAAAQLKILNENADLISQIEAAVPDEIRDDFMLSEQSARQRAEARDASVPPKDVVAANLRLRKFRVQNCPQPAGG
jgi:hypothetical protein